MEEEKNLLNELMKRYLEINMSVKRMEADQKHSPGCIIKKGPQKQYITTLKKMLRAVGISEESIMNEYKLQKQKKEQEANRRLIAKEEAGKKRYAENYIHLTDKGEQVASKSELIIANILYSYGIKYEYERPITINGITYKPDFTIWRPDGSIVLWEHAGLMDDASYAWDFQQKLRKYQAAGFRQGLNLIVTADDNGAFSAVEARRMVEVYRLV